MDINKLEEYCQGIILKRHIPKRRRAQTDKAIRDANYSVIELLNTVIPGEPEAQRRLWNYYDSRCKR